MFEQKVVKLCKSIRGKKKSLLSAIHVKEKITKNVAQLKE